MKLWITGSKGLVGTALLKAEPGSFATTHLEVDIADLGAVHTFVAAHPTITHIVNCAAMAQVDLAEEKVQAAYAVNATGVANLGKVASHNGIKLLHLSTDYVFDGKGKIPLKETDPVAPCSVYGKSKLEGERLLQAIMPSACILRTSSVFGSGEKNLIAKVWQLFQEKKELPFTADHWNCPTYVGDLVKVMVQMLNHSGLYHVSNRGAASKYDFGMKMREIMIKLGMKMVTEKIHPVPGASFSLLAMRPVYSVFDLFKIEQRLAFQIRSWEEALEEYLCQKYALSPAS